MSRTWIAVTVLIMQVFLLSLGSQALAAKTNVVFPQDNYVPGWVKSERMLHFGAGNLFDYIDGGAELFLEFGFDELLVQRYSEVAADKATGGEVAGGGELEASKEGAELAEREEEIAVEVYVMESSEAALGIYLSKCGKETPIKGIKARNSGDRFQFVVLKGDCLMMVNNFSGNEKLMQAMVALTRRTLESIPKGRRVTLLNRLPSKDFVPGTGIIIRGPYALQPIFTFGRGDVLQLGGKIFGVAGDYVGANGDIYTRIFVFYPEPKAALSAFDNLVSNLDPYLEVTRKWEREFSFKDYRDRFGTVRVEGETIAIEINLPEQPEHR